MPVTKNVHGKKQQANLQIICDNLVRVPWTGY
jgi:hypothetical protein